MEVRDYRDLEAKKTVIDVEGAKLIKCAIYMKNEFHHYMNMAKLFKADGDHRHCVKYLSIARMNFEGYYKEAKELRKKYVNIDRWFKDETRIPRVEDLEGIHLC